MLQQRDKFVSRLGVLLVTLGSAVGLGNIWKFPYLTGENGGGAFLIVYLLSTLLIGLPVMISEIMLGRTARKDTINSMKHVAPNAKFPWWIIGVMGVLSAFFIMAFYSEVVGWIFAYVPKAISGEILTTDGAVTGAAFGTLISNPWVSLVVQWLALAVVAVIISLGVSKGIEKVLTRLMPVLFGILIIVVIRSLTLPGALEGVKFLFKPDFGSLTAAGVLVAMGLAFFKLSVGMGCMITYGSYFRDDSNIPMTAVRVMLADLLVSMLAGLAIFPAVFAYGLQPDAGPSLLFITIPTVFASMPLGNVFMVLFFILAAITPIGAMISLVEVPVAYLSEQFHMDRKKATWLITGALAVVGSLAALSNSVLATTTLFGKTFFDLFDFLSSNVLLPAGGLLIAIFVGWVWGGKKIKEALSNQGSLKNAGLVQAFILVVKFVAPVLITLVFLNSLGVIKL